MRILSRDRYPDRLRIDTSLVCAFKPSKIGMIRRAVLEKDPDAFVIICDAQEIYGEGFGDANSGNL